jgi:hypothetical protein
LKRGKSHLKATKLTTVANRTQQVSWLVFRKSVQAITRMERTQVQLRLSGGKWFRNQVTLYVTATVVPQNIQLFRAAYADRHHLAPELVREFYD